MKRIGLFLIAAMMISILPTMADNFAPPDYFDDPLSYHAEWEFANGQLPIDGIDPDSESNGGSKSNEVLYTLTETLITLNGSGWKWIPADNDGGIVNTNGDASLEIEILNWVDAEPEKHIRVQITYIGQVAPTVVGATGYEGANSYGPFAPYYTKDVDSVHRFSDILMQPNPDWERIEIFVPSGTVIDEIVVDTVSIPEPSAIIMVLMSCGGLLFVRRRLMM